MKLFPPLTEIAGIKRPCAIRLDFEAVGDPPGVYLVDAMGKRIAEIYDEPTMRPGIVDPLRGDEIIWSPRPEHWKIGSITMVLLHAINSM